MPCFGEGIDIFDWKLCKACEKALEPLSAWKTNTEGSDLPTWTRDQHYNDAEWAEYKCWQKRYERGSYKKQSVTKADWERERDRIDLASMLRFEAEWEAGKEERDRVAFTKGWWGPGIDAAGYKKPGASSDRYRTPLPIESGHHFQVNTSAKRQDVNVRELHRDSFIPKRQSYETLPLRGTLAALKLAHRAWYPKRNGIQLKQIQELAADLRSPALRIVAALRARAGVVVKVVRKPWTPRAVVPGRNSSIFSGWHSDGVELSAK